MHTDHTYTYVVPTPQKMRLLPLLIVTLLLIVHTSSNNDDDKDDVDRYCEDVCNSLSGNRDHYFSCLYGCRAGFDRSQTCDVDTEIGIVERFEKYPFPPTSEKEVDYDDDDKKGSVHFDMINHFCWKGQRDLCASSETFRMLVVGGGKGSSTSLLISTMIRKQVPSWEVYYLDISQSALDYTEQRLKSQRFLLPNVKLIRGNLNKIRDLIGKNIQFDFIEAVGVIHHMPRPETGMRAIRDMLKKNGCASVMLYGELGRTGVYDVQSMMRFFNSKNDDDWNRRLEMTRRLLKYLPSSNRLKLDDVRWKALDSKKRGGIFHDDVLLADLLLPVLDKPYTVPDIARLSRRSDLSIVKFWPTVLYEPETHLQSLFMSSNELDLDMKRSIESASYLKRCEIAELAAGNIQQHWFFVRRMQDSDLVNSAVPSDLDFVPVLVNCGATSRGFDLVETIRQTSPRHNLIYRYQNMKYEFEMNELMLNILSRIDGTKTVRKILLETMIDLKVDDISKLSTSWTLLFHRLVGIHKMALRGVVRDVCASDTTY